MKRIEILNFARNTWGSDNRVGKNYILHPTDIWSSLRGLEKQMLTSPLVYMLIHNNYTNRLEIVKLVLEK